MDFLQTVTAGSSARQRNVRRFGIEPVQGAVDGVDEQADHSRKMPICE